MEHKQDLSIVLKWVAFEDRHRIVTGLTANHGKISVLVKNSIGSRRFGGALEPLALSEWNFTEKKEAELFFLQEATLKKSFDQIPKYYAAYAAAGVMSELALKLAPERFACPELFRLYTNALQLLDEHSTNEDIFLPLLNGYIGKILQWSGCQPQVQNCFQCKVRLETLFLYLFLNISSGHFVCETCAQNGVFQTQTRLSTPVFLDFKLSLSTPLRSYLNQKKASLEEHQSLFEILKKYMIYHLPAAFPKGEGSFKSLRFLNSKSNAPHHPENSL